MGSVGEDEDLSDIVSSFTFVPRVFLKHTPIFACSYCVCVCMCVYMPWCTYEWERINSWVGSHFPSYLR